MARDDGNLYTGTSSASFGNSRVQPIRREKSEEKAEKRIKLSPVSELVMQELDKEIAQLKSLDYTLVNQLIASGIPHALEIDLLSSEKTITKLKEVKIRLQNILMESKA